MKINKPRCKNCGSTKTRKYGTIVKVKNPGIVWQKWHCRACGSAKTITKIDGGYEDGK